MNYVKIFFRLLFFLIVPLAPCCCFSQLPEYNLEEIVNRQNQNNARQKQRVQKYVDQKKLLTVFSDRNGNNIRLIDVDEFGLPVYFTTLNAAAAVTLGLDKLKSGGSLGMDLNGEGMTVGVWDESLVKNHVEFDNRIISRQGIKLSTHSTHITGTILASGVQVAAKGMASRAKATTWDYDNDEAEMASLAKEDETGLLFSNHSYGTVMGFFKDEDGKWEWAGNSTISSLEDYRFGFYSDRSKTIDQIAFNAPYYTVVWAGGNDRANVGDGSHPPDGGTTGYDILGPDGVSKNVITVGAVEKVLTYTGPSSVIMSNFSSWGPTDDGRIKPDLVGDGVLVYSPAVTDTGEDTYASYSGTSVSAPNVTGALMLLQELYRNLHGGKFMKAATLKALAIHTAREAGLNSGPDYSFGWGLLDGAAAANVLLRQDQQSVVILENNLTNEENFIWEFTPKANTKVTATIVWTDPADNPVAPVLDPTNRMLVNDLDIVLIDNSNAKIFPWTLNPSNPAVAATKGNNSIDNVEKIEFENPGQQKSILKISHKGQLVNDQQNYSFILTYTPVNAKNTYYWIGNSGNWNDISKWSFTSGGAPVNSIPDMNSRVIVDENSFSTPDQTISLVGDGVCASLIWLTKKQSALALNDNKLTVNGSLIVSTNSLSTSTSGAIEFMGPASSQNEITLGDSDLSKAQLLINGGSGSTWKLNGRGNIGGITLSGGALLANNVVLKTRTFNAESANGKTLDISNATITGVVESVMDVSHLQLITNSATSLQLANDEDASLLWNNISFNGSLFCQASNATLSGGAFFNDVMVAGTLNINGNNKFNAFTIAPGARINFQSGSVQTLSQNTHLESNPTARINLVSDGTALLNFDGHYKLCFDNLDISGVGVEGDVAVSAGVGSTLSNAANWSSRACDETLFADFSLAFNCEGSLTKFTDLSEGNIVSWEWNFGDASTNQSSSAEQNPFHIYNSTSSYNVNLKITDGITTSEHSKTIEIHENDLPPNSIIASSNLLVSQLISDSYQWYSYERAIPNQTGRSFNFDGEPGSYFVVINSSTCNQPSSPFLVTSVDEQHLYQYVRVYPNPAYERINITVPQSGLKARVSLTTSQGKTIFSSIVDDDDFYIDTEKLPAGIYVLEIFSKEIIRKKVVIKSTER